MCIIIHTLGLRGWVFECTCMSKCLQWTGKTLLRGNVALHGSLGESSLQRVGSRLGPWGPAQQRTQHVCWMILGTQLLVKHEFFRGRLLLALVASGKLCWGIGNQKCPSKFFFWYSYTLSVYDCDNMLWLRSIRICVIMIGYVRIQGSSFCHSFFYSWLLVQRRFTCKHPCSGNGQIYKWKCLCAGGTAVLFRVWLFAFSFLWLLPSISRFHSQSTTVPGPLAYLCSAPIMHHLAMLCKR